MIKGSKPQKQTRKRWEAPRDKETGEPLMGVRELAKKVSKLGGGLAAASIGAKVKEKARPFLKTKGNARKRLLDEIIRRQRKKSP